VPGRPGLTVRCHGLKDAAIKDYFFFFFVEDYRLMEVCESWKPRPEPDINLNPGRGWPSRRATSDSESVTWIVGYIWPAIWIVG
jgi:hypothetical protein